MLLLVCALSLAHITIGSCQISFSRDELKEVDTLVIRNRSKKVIQRLEDYRIGFLGVERKPGPQAVQDLNRDGHPDAIFETWSGGAHGSNRYVIWSLGPRPYRMLYFDKNNIWGDERDFTLVDLDGDRIPEIKTWYDGFAYTYANAYTAPIPLVLKLKAGRYSDATTRFPKLLRSAQDQAWVQMREALQKPEPIDHAASHGSDVVHVLALAELIGNRQESLQRLQRELSAKDLAWARRQLPFIRKRLAERGKRFIAASL